MVDKVKPLKLENSATGGTENNVFPTETDPTEDYVSAKGIALENSDNTTIRGDAGVMKFKDTAETTELSLTSLLKVRVSANDTTPDVLTNKVTVSGVITKSDVNDGADEDLNLDVQADAINTTLASFKDDFYGGTYNNIWTETASGAGSEAVTVTGSSGYGGVISLTAGNGNGRNIRLSFSPRVNFGHASSSTFHARVTCGASTLTDSLREFGFIDDSMAQGTFFRHDSAVDGHWYAVTDNGAGETTTDTGISASSSWKTFKIVCESSTTIKFYINDSLVATHTTNIPSSTTYTMPSFYTKTTSGSSYHWFFCDWVRLTQNRAA